LALCCSCSFDVNVTPDKRKVFLHAEKLLLQAFQQVNPLTLLLHMQTLYAINLLNIVVYCRPCRSFGSLLDSRMVLTTLWLLHSLVPASG
jgi:hypothetical protein